MGKYKRTKGEAVPDANEPAKRSTTGKRAASSNNSNPKTVDLKKVASVNGKSLKSCKLTESRHTRSTRSWSCEVSKKNLDQANSSALKQLQSNTPAKSSRRTKAQSEKQLAVTAKSRRKKESTQIVDQCENTKISPLSEVHQVSSQKDDSLNINSKKLKTSWKSVSQPSREHGVKNEKPDDASVKNADVKNHDVKVEAVQQSDEQSKELVENMADTPVKRKRRRASVQKSYKEPQLSDEEESVDDSDEDSDFDPTTETKRSRMESDSDNEDESTEQMVDSSLPKKKGSRKRSAVLESPKLSYGVRKGKGVQKSSHSKNKRMSKKNKSVGSCNSESSSDDGDDWEEVADLPTELLGKNGVQITLDLPKAKKKGYDWRPYFKMIWRRYWRVEHECVHKVELMCLFVHGLMVNGVCNDPLMKALAMSLYGKTTLKGKQCTSANIANVLSKLKEKVTVEPQPVSQTSINTLTLLDDLVEGLHTNTLHRTDHRVLLMLAALRALGATARLCMGWYPIPFRVPHYQKQRDLRKAEASENGSAASKKIKEYRKSNPFAADSTKHLDKQIWLEVYCSSVQKWLPVGSNGDVVDDVASIVKYLRKPLTYIVSYDNGGKFKDLTSKYDPKWMTGTKKLRVGDEWWEETILPYKAKESKKTKQEDDQLKSRLEEMPFPTTIGGFKDHPLYVLERHLLKFEAIYPRTAIPLGYTKNKEAIYSRSCVVTLNSREMLLKQAKQVKDGEEPYKYVKPLPTHKDIKNGVKITAATQPVFGDWQTEPYDPPTAENGKVPRNAFGNVDLFKPEMLPKGCVQLRDPYTPRVCRKLGVDYAQLMVGWWLTKGRNIPQYDGWAICKEYEEAFLVALDDYKEEEKQKAKALREKRAYDNWKKLIRGTQIRAKLQNKYGKESC